MVPGSEHLWPFRIQKSVYLPHFASLDRQTGCVLLPETDCPEIPTQQA